MSALILRDDNYALEVFAIFRTESKKNIQKIFMAFRVDENLKCREIVVAWECMDDECSSDGKSFRTKAWNEKSRQKRTWTKKKTYTDKKP